MPSAAASLTHCLIDFVYGSSAFFRFFLAFSPAICGIPLGRPFGFSDLRFSLSRLRRSAFFSAAHLSQYRTEDGTLNRSFPQFLQGFVVIPRIFVSSKFAEAAAVNVTADFISACQERLAGFCFFPARRSDLITDCAVFCVFLAAAVTVLRTVFTVQAWAIHCPIPRL